MSKNGKSAPEAMLLARWMEEHGLNQTSLAKELGFHSSYISLILGGQRVVSDSFRMRFLRVYGLVAMQEACPVTGVMAEVGE